MVRFSEVDNLLIFDARCIVPGEIRRDWCEHRKPNKVYTIEDALWWGFVDRRCSWPMLLAAAVLYSAQPFFPVGLCRKSSIQRVVLATPLDTVTYKILVKAQLVVDGR